MCVYVCEGGGDIYSFGFLDLQLPKVEWSSQNFQPINLMLIQSFLCLSSSMGQHVCHLIVQVASRVRPQLGTSDTSLFLMALFSQNHKDSKAIKMGKSSKVG